MTCKDCGRAIEDGKRCGPCTTVRRAKQWDAVKQWSKATGPVALSLLLAIVTRGRIKPRI